MTKATSKIIMPSEPELIQDSGEIISIYDHLSREQKEELALLLGEKARRHGQRLFDHVFTEQGANFNGEFLHPRHLYPKHLTFFSEGAEYIERCFMAANRVGKCVTFQTLIPHPDGTSTMAGELYERGDPFKVLAWDGDKVVEAMAAHPIKKPAERCYKIYLSNGDWFECAANHRVLTSSGYVFAEQLLESFGGLPLTSLEPDQLVRAASDRHSSQTPQDFEHYYPDYHRFDDEQPHSDQGIYQAFSPLQDDVRQHNSLRSCLGGLVNKYTSNQKLSFYPLSILGVHPRLSALYAGCLSHILHNAAQSLTGCSPLFQQPLLASQGQLQSACATAQCQSESAGLFAGLCRALSKNEQPCLAAHQAHPQFQDAFYLQQPSSSLDQYSLLSPLNDGNRIVSFKPIGVQEVYDFTVPLHKNYIAAGVVHHNTFAGGFETSAHLTGLYPDWWIGRRFDKPVQWWAAGKTNETTRDIIQNKLFGEVIPASRKTLAGTGLVPGRMIGAMTWKQGVQDLIDNIKIKHVSGGWSTLGLKAYQQGRGAFEGTERDGIWMDEEPPAEIYDECLIRTATTQGMIMLTFTPLEGMSDVVMSFMPKSMRPKTD